VREHNRQPANTTGFSKNYNAPITDFKLLSKFKISNLVYLESGMSVDLERSYPFDPLIAQAPLLLVGKRIIVHGKTKDPGRVGWIVHFQDTHVYRTM
jgi:hypothetical protein